MIRTAADRGINCWKVIKNEQLCICLQKMKHARTIWKGIFMNDIILRGFGGAVLLLTIILPAQAQTLIYLENFNGGTADWADESYSGATYNVSGGHDGGAYISVNVDIDTTGGGAQGLGGYTAARCSDGPSQAPGLNCSGGNFNGNWYFTEGVQVLRFWFRHNSTKPGGIVPQVRVAIPSNSPGGSALFSAVPANNWTQLTLPIDPQSSEWDSQWGSVIPDAVKVLKNVGRLQPGFFIDPNDAVYIENGVTFDLDDVEILGSPSLTADVVSVGELHPGHEGPPHSINTDSARARVLGASILAGDPVDIDVSDIVAGTVRIGRLGGAINYSNYSVDHDSDGNTDAEFRSYVYDSTGHRNDDGSFGSCAGTWAMPTTMPLRAELISGEIIAGEDLTINAACNKACH
jgi:hypothetical protein